MILYLVLAIIAIIAIYAILFHRNRKSEFSNKYSKFIDCPDKIPKDVLYKVASGIEREFGAYKADRYFKYMDQGKFEKIPQEDMQSIIEIAVQEIVENKCATQGMKQSI